MSNGSLELFLKLLGSEINLVECLQDTLNFGYLVSKITNQAPVDLFPDEEILRWSFSKFWMILLSQSESSPNFFDISNTTVTDKLDVHDHIGNIESENFAVLSEFRMAHKQWFELFVEEPDVLELQDLINSIRENLDVLLSH